MKLEPLIWLFFLPIVFILLVAFSFGFNTIFGTLEFTIIMYVTFTLPMILVTICTSKVTIKKADSMELKREDDILLQAIAFSQAALWIYLNILPAGSFVDLMKWIVPSSAIITYIIRAYSKLKNNNVWRFRSIYAITIVLGISFSALIGSALNSWTGVVIDGIDVTYWLMIMPISLIPVFLLFNLKDRVKPRYGL